ncbi:ubiquitin carboxyl-terminal hydrolase [Holotrichia oblita]|uniref:Ubiquitin carboxyl-terminal hydrolase n=1 Tax=Holotrichia oblita TaxID=644536 RepID=A0ACB9TXA9_HOLOL|nr:ubiquitin carboxyl-terminal hydrolase [Holotrichia oblita]
MAWFPLESNPDVSCIFIESILNVSLKSFLGNEQGVSEKWNIVDVYGLESDALAWVPKPVLSVILLFPCSDSYYNHSTQQCNEIKEKGQVIASDVFFLKQVVSNACGTIALIHSVANNTDKIELTDGKFKELLDSSKDLSPEERGELLQKVAAQIMHVHQELAQEGQTELKPNEAVNHHFIAFVHKNGCLYELDGRKEFPINHGPSTPETLLEVSNNTFSTVSLCLSFVQLNNIT